VKAYLVSLAHATSIARLPSIYRQGLSPAYSRGAAKLVYLHSPSQSPWALKHCAARHGVPEGEMVLIRVRVPRSWLRRLRRGRYGCPVVIPPAYFVAVAPCFAVAQGQLRARGLRPRALLVYTFTSLDSFGGDP
jgi:hypothetical protein